MGIMQVNYVRSPVLMGHRSSADTDGKPVACNACAKHAVQMASVTISAFISIQRDVM